VIKPKHKHSDSADLRQGEPDLKMNQVEEVSSTAMAKNPGMDDSVTKLTGTFLCEILL